MSAVPSPAPRSGGPLGPVPGRSFGEALRAAAGTAALSPSSHNCQPWAVAVAAGPAARRAAARLLGDGGDGGDDSGNGGTGTGGEEHRYLVLALDRARQLDALPAHAAEMLVSCGLYWRLLLRALAARGWTADRVRFTGGTGNSGGPGGFGPAWPESWSAPLCVVRLRPGAPAEDPAALHATALARRTNRAPYRTGEIDPAVLEELLAPAGDATGDTAGAGVVVRHIGDARVRARFAALVARHGGRDFSHGPAWRETHSFLRRNHADARAHGDGFALDQLFGPLSRLRRLALRAALAPATMGVLCLAGYHRLLARRLAATVRAAPVLVAMGLPAGEPGPGDLVRGGARLADYWLRATEAGLALHPVSVVLQHDDPRRRVQSLLGLPGRPFLVARLGRPTTGFPPAPRRAAEAAFRTI
ncbi:RedV protein [Streptomyces sp. TRM 70361]|uniref:RedV protein n=1 Tax=Streptomyces sp. TRM 70361 TaxID=3116553 RepID=UPI002E7B2178|nr:RedV protein [Streptomyces sp. TRM 70361]MEE1941355.1 RedV protein [Streptomyces sp. TRM 70361]